MLGGTALTEEAVHAFVDGGDGKRRPTSRYCSAYISDIAAVAAPTGSCVARQCESRSVATSAV